MFTKAFTLLALASAASIVQANETYMNGDYVVEITGNGNVPKYTFYSNDDDSLKYKVQFSQMYEADESGNKIGSTNVALSSLAWTMSPDETANSTVFWFNGTAQNDEWETLAFRNEILDDTVKFDVILDGYTFQDDDAASLNLAWKMLPGDSDRRSLQEETLDTESVSSTEICYGAAVEGERNVCFNIAEEAEVTDMDGNTSPVAVSIAEDSMIVISYDRFEGNLYHDPEFGFGDEVCSGILAFICILKNILAGLFSSIWPF